MINAAEAAQIAKQKTMNTYNCLAGIISNAIEEQAKKGEYSLVISIEKEVVLCIGSDTYIHNTMKEDYPNLLRDLKIDDYKVSEFVYNPSDYNDGCESLLKVLEGKTTVLTIQW